MSSELDQLATQYLIRNYDYLWLKTMLEKCGRVPAGSTLIIGSSHALNGIQESAWKSAVNCSMHSQDIYYDFLCAKRAMSGRPEGTFVRCFIVMGYYIAFQDLSLSKVSRESVISSIYYPIFGDARHWENPTGHDPWGGFGEIPEPIKAICEKAAVEQMLKYGTYYSAFRARGTFFDLKGRVWAQTTAEERWAMGQYRAESHNKIFQHKASFEENKQILQEFVSFLHAHDVLPVVVITPFTPEYNRFVLPEMKESVLELVDSVQEDVHYVDFNQDSSLFDLEDFMDTDHLSAKGAEMVSGMLVEMFGE